MIASTSANDSGRLTRLLGYLQADPDNLALLRDAADQALQDGCWEKAGVLVEAALALAPDDAASRYRMAVIAARRRDGPASLALTQALIDEGQRHDVVLFQHAHALILSGRHAEAEPLLEGLLPRAHALPGFDHLYVRALHGAGRIDDAIRVASNLGDDPAARGMLSLLYADTDRLEEGGALAAAVLATTPDNIDALLAAGTVALAMEEPGTALPCFERAVASHADNGRAWMGIGLARLHKQDFDGARSAFEKTVRLIPSHLGSWNTLAWIQILQKDHAAANATLQAAMRIDRNFGETHGTLAVLRAFEKNWAEAKHHADVALRLQPASFAGRYAQTLLLEHQGNPERARQSLEEIMRNFKAPAGGNLADIVRRRAARHAAGPSTTTSNPNKEHR